MVETTISSEKKSVSLVSNPIFLLLKIHHLRPRCWKSRISHAISTLGSNHLVLRPVTFSGGLKTSLIFCWKMLEELGWKYPWNPVVDHQISIISFPSWSVCHLDPLKEPNGDISDTIILLASLRLRLSRISTRPSRMRLAVPESEKELTKKTDPTPYLLALWQSCPKNLTKWGTLGNHIPTKKKN